jgi:hypothetical protein
MSKLVFVMSIPRATTSGISDWVSETSGLKLKKTKVGRSQDILVALPSAKVGGLANYISYNYKIDPATGKAELDKDGNPILLQTYLETKWNKPKDFFSNKLVEANYKGDGRDLGYYYNKSWPLLDGTTVFDLDKMDDEIGYYVLLASSKVANSEREWREHRWPKATHYIALENESDALKYQRAKAKANAVSALAASGMNETTRAKILVLLDISNSTDKLSAEQSFNFLFDYIENASSTNTNLEKFNHYCDLLKSAEGKVRFETMYLLKQAQNLRIVYAKQDIWTWIRESGATLVIGDKYSEAVDFLLNPKKLDEVEELRNQIKAKKG